MFGLDPVEILIIGAVALIAIGPKDLPNAMKTAARWLGAGRKMAREFQGHVDQLVREAELEELREKVRKVTSQPLGSHIESMVDPDRELREALAQPEYGDSPVAQIEPPPETIPAEPVAQPENAWPALPPAGDPEVEPVDTPPAPHDV